MVAIRNFGDVDMRVESAKEFRVNKATLSALIVFFFGGRSSEDFDEKVPSLASFSVNDLKRQSISSVWLREQFS